MIRRARPAIHLMVVALGVTALLWGVSTSTADRIAVAPGTAVQPVLDAARPGATVILEPGIHAGPFTVTRPVALEGRAGARIVAGPDMQEVVSVRASGARISGLRIEGGSTGLLVRDANDVTVSDVVVAGADLHGIEVVDASARITGARVGGLRHPMAQGIEVRNADHRPETVVLRSEIRGGREGLVSHVARVRFEDNAITGTTMRAITITEMSAGIAQSNSIANVRGAGLFCGDMSRCAFAGNVVTGVAPGDGARTVAGWGLVVNYYATASTENDVLEGAAGAAQTFVGSRIADRSPLQLGSGWRALIPTSVAMLVAVGALGLILIPAAPVTGAFLRRSRAARPSPWVGSVVVTALVAGVVVQTFHMLEHFVQVYRVYFDGVPSRGALVGSVVDTEWVHFTYNAAVLGLFAIVLYARRTGWIPRSKTTIGDTLIGAGLAIQTYHVLEHTAKVIQHVTTGAKVNPGILGATIDLVWFHFAINLAVYAAFAVACVVYLRRPARTARAATPSPVPG